MKNFANWLSSELTDNNISRTELSKAIGVNRSTVHRWLSGETLPNVYQWQGIAYFLVIQTGKELETVLVEMSFNLLPLEK
jgi:transcriptional regulator with XRE-family HTH domain